MKLLSQMVEEYQADGVIDVILQACHTYAVESLAIKRHVRDRHGIPTWRWRPTTPAPTGTTGDPAGGLYRNAVRRCRVTHHRD